MGKALYEYKKSIFLLSINQIPGSLPPLPSLPDRRVRQTRFFLFPLAFQSLTYLCSMKGNLLLNTKPYWSVPERAKHCNEIPPCPQECPSWTVLDYSTGAVPIPVFHLWSLHYPGVFVDFSLLEASSPHNFPRKKVIKDSNICLYLQSIWNSSFLRIVTQTYPIWITHYLCCSERSHSTITTEKGTLSQGGFTSPIQVGKVWLFELCLLIFLLPTTSEQSQAPYPLTFLYRGSGILPGYQHPEWYLPTLLPDYA